MEYGKWLSKHIKWDIDSGTLIYRNLISPTFGRRAFPEGYFDVKFLVFEKKGMFCAVIQLFGKTVFVSI